MAKRKSGKRKGKAASDQPKIPPLRANNIGAPAPRSVVSERLVHVGKLMKQGGDPVAMQRELADEWNVSRRMVRRYQRAVRLQWIKVDGGTTVEMDRAELRQQLNDAYVGARLARDYRAMNQLIRTKAMIFLPQQTRIDLTTGGRPLAVGADGGMSPEQAAAELEAAARIADREKRARAAIGDASAPGLPPAPITFIGGNKP